MQATINMAQALLEQGRELWEQDRYEEATRVLSCLLGLRVIPPKIAERAQFYLGDIELSQGQYFKARRHLAAAIANGSAGGDTHFMMACALDWDDDSDPRRAYNHYRQAVALEPGQPLYSSAYALMRIRQRQGKSKFDREALRRLRDAFAADPEDADVVYNYVSGLIEMGRHAEAEIALRRARKRWTSHPAFEELWFEFLNKTERAPTGTTNPTGRFGLRVVAADEPEVIPFPAVDSSVVGTKPLKPHARLGTALQTLEDGEVAELARRLGLRPCADAHGQRRNIRQALLDRNALEALLRRLSIAGRHLVQVLSNSGGHLDVKSLRLRVDGPASHRPHFAGGQPSRPLDELRRVGLVFVATRAPVRTGADLAMIPSDLNRVLREVLPAVGSSGYSSRLPRRDVAE